MLAKEHEAEPRKQGRCAMSVESTGLCVSSRKGEGGRQERRGLVRIRKGSYTVRKRVSRREEMA